MSQRRGAYPPEFRQQVVELVKAGRKPSELARETAGIPKHDGKRTRDRPGTEARLREAVGTLLLREGASGIGVNAVAAEAGCDKKLISRYFGGIEGLTRAFVEDAALFPRVEDLLPQPLEVFYAESLRTRLRFVLGRYTEAVEQRPMTIELMCWEFVERSAITTAFETRRENFHAELMGKAFPEIGPSSRDLIAVAAILGAAANYLVLRRRHIRVFAHCDIGSVEGWSAMLDVMSGLGELAYEKTSDKPAS